MRPPSSHALVRALLVAIGCTPTVGAQPIAATGAPAPTAYLDVLRARGDLRQAATELARADALADRAMLSSSEHEERRASYERARLAYLGSLLAIGARDRVFIDRGLKARAADGRLLVTLTLHAERAPLIGLDARDATADSVDVAAIAATRRGTVALKSEAGPNGTTISRPYEQPLPALVTGQKRRVEFELLQDVADVVVAIDGVGPPDERRIRLEIDGTPNALAVDAVQSSLAADLGSQVVYDLRVQRPRPRAGATRLAVRGLPPEATFEFRDPDGRTRLNQLRFADGATSTRVQLAVSLPSRPSPALGPDVPIAFDVVASDDRDGAGPAAEGIARLELVPRGIARLEVRPAALALQASDRGSTALGVTVRNAGTGRIDDVRLRAEPPARWQAAFEPASIAALLPGDERRVRLVLRPPPDADVGDYELRVGVDDAGSARRIEVEDKLIRVRVGGGGGLGAPLAGALGAIGLTVLVVAYGRRWVNR